MAELAVITWLWGTKYSPRDAARLARQVRKNFRAAHTFYLFTDAVPNTVSLPGVVVRQIKDLDLCDRPCFCRLRMFDPDWQKENGFTDWIASLDLDLVITGPLDEVLKPKNDFMILTGVNAINPNPLNGSMMMLKAGAHPEVWRDFSLQAAGEIKFHEFPDDQGWIWHKLPNASGWKPGAQGVYAFQKPGWPVGYALPEDANVVAFIGKRKPENYVSLPWVKKYWAKA